MGFNMINTVCRLISPMIFEEVYTEVDSLDGKVIVRPTYLSICQADQRYYQGNRDEKTLDEKLPMSLIHEGIGVVVKDPTDTFNIGDNVVLIPNTPIENDEIVSENYLRTSKFRASGFDGFMEDYIILPEDRLVKLPDNINFEVAAFTELISVCLHGICRFSKISHKRRNIIGIWGDGNLGYIVSLLLKTINPECKVYVFGVHRNKLDLFEFVDKTFLVSEVPDELTIDHGFECVGGDKSSDAINQIIDLINPEGTIALLGVSENNILINTRMVLEKGLRLFGTSRSGREDFINTINLFKTYPNLVNSLEKLINEVVRIRTLNDIDYSFKLDMESNFGKTVLIWDK